MPIIAQIQQDLRAKATARRREASAWYFKPEPGVRDVFLGVTVPDQRLVSKKYYRTITPIEVQRLLHSDIHEERLTALLIWVLQYKRGDEQKKAQIYELYMKNTQWINNWDLVDTSARDIVGEYIYDKSRQVLEELSSSKNVWERRIAIISTSYFIQLDDFEWTLKLSEQYLSDSHHYIHKATGWMLREVGKRDQKVLREFLDEFAAAMPRTMLRYAIEKFDKPTRKAYLAIKKSPVQ
ncbi:MAG: hypothetical protein QG628_297 [Patescibacteria group bacterium]|nr:hypothetical protein [Patescibacteria group bacterium]